MLKNYVLIALRNLSKNRLYTSIKILGLAIGLGVSLIIALIITEELSFDKFHSKHENIVRLLINDRAQGVSSSLVGVSYPALAPAVAESFPEVVDYSRMIYQGRQNIRIGDKFVSNERTYLTESGFFRMFDYEIIHGPREGLLEEPRTAVVTEELAYKMFNESNVVGKIMEINGNEIRIVAVAANPPEQSHIQFDMLSSLVPAEDQENWVTFLTSFRGISVYGYLELNQKVDIPSFSERLLALAIERGGYEFFEPTIQYLDDIHTKSNQILFEQNYRKIDGSNLTVLSAVAFFVLVLASVNFMNLVTARASGRAKEIGIRKVLGATRDQLIAQYLSESVVLTLISAFVGLVLVQLSLPFVNNMYGKAAEFSMILTPSGIGISLGLVLIVGLLSGLYPAFVLSKAKIIPILKGTFGGIGGGLTIRKALVVFQFAISITLLSATAIAYQQMQYINSKDLGYDRDQVLTIPLNNQTLFGQVEPLKNELSGKPGIVSVATSNTQMGNQLGRGGFSPEGADQSQNFITSVMNIDEDFIDMIGMEVVEGRGFDPDNFPADTLSSIMINQAMLEIIDWNQEEAIGRTFTLGATGPNPQTVTIVGIVKDFHFASVRHKIEPVMIGYQRTNGNLTVRIDGNDTEIALNSLREVWNNLSQGYELNYTFLDDAFQNQYFTERSFANMFTHFSILAILIAMLGLLGLSAYSAEQRQKEISIRKILGAPMSNIIYTLSKDFILLVATAFVVAVPLAWVGMDKWLAEFAYRIGISWEVFLFAGGLSIIVALLTVSYQSFKAATANPINALKQD